MWLKSERMKAYRILKFLCNSPQDEKWCMSGHVDLVGVRHVGFSLERLGIFECLTKLAHLSIDIGLKCLS